MANPIQNRWAFLVGINQYRDPQIANLNYCVSDVTAMEQVLTQAGYTMVCLRDDLDPRGPRFPNYKNIEDEFLQLAARVEPDDLLLVYFACHGTRQGDGVPRLLAEDTRLAKLEIESIAVAEVEQAMRDTGAGRLVMILDACHMVLGTEQRSLADPEFVRNVYELATGFALIAASTDQQGAYELGDLEHGLLNYYLLQGLTGQAENEAAGFVTVGSLQRYVMNELKKKTVELGYQQQPMGRAEGNLGDMILVDWRGRKKPVLETAKSAAAGQGQNAKKSVKLGMAQQMKAERLKRQLKAKQEQYVREMAKLGGLDGAAEYRVEQTLENLGSDIERLEMELQELLNGE